MALTIYLIIDPMCSWCWGFRSVWHEFQSELPATVRVVDLMGGLAPDTDQPMDAATRDYVQGAWRAVAARTGAKFNFAFWDECSPRRTTYPACRAVVAAGLQTLSARKAMYEAVQRAYFLLAKNPSEESTLIALAGELGLDDARFAQDLSSRVVDQQLAAELYKVREFGVTGFPSLIWHRYSPDAPARFGLLAAGYTDLDHLRARWAELLA